MLFRTVTQKYQGKTLLRPQPGEQSPPGKGQTCVHRATSQGPHDPGPRLLTCIDDRLLLQRKGRGLHECRHEAEFEVVFLQESLFMPGSHLLDVTVETSDEILTTSEALSGLSSGN